MGFKQIDSISAAIGAAAGIAGTIPVASAQYKNRRRKVKQPLSKSYVNGKFVRALDLTAKQKKAIRYPKAESLAARKKIGRKWGGLDEAGDYGVPIPAIERKGQFGQSRGPQGNRSDPDLMSFPGGEQQRKDLVAAGKGRKRGRDNRAFKVMEEMAPGASQSIGGFAIRQGSKRGGTNSIFFNNKAIKQTEKVLPGYGKYVVPHEHAHGSPKRDAYRMHKVTSNPERSGGEEARADFLSTGGHSYKDEKSPSAYALNARATAANYTPEGRATAIKTTRKIYRQHGLKLDAKVKRMFKQPPQKAFEEEQPMYANYIRVNEKMFAAKQRKVNKSMFGQPKRKPAGSKPSAPGRPKPQLQRPNMQAPSAPSASARLPMAPPKLAPAAALMNVRKPPMFPKLTPTTPVAPTAATPVRKSQMLEMISTSEMVQGERLAVAKMGIDGKLAVATGVVGAGTTAYYGNKIRRGRKNAGNPKLTPFGIGKSEPDSADVHIKGVLRPIKKVKTVSKGFPGKIPGKGVLKPVRPLNAPNGQPSIVPGQGGGRMAPKPLPKPKRN